MLMEEGWEGDRKRGGGDVMASDMVKVDVSEKDTLGLVWREGEVEDNCIIFTYSVYMIKYRTTYTVYTV